MHRDHYFFKERDSEKSFRHRGCLINEFDFRAGIRNFLTVFLLYKSIISCGKSSHLKIRNSSIMPCKGFSFGELPKLAHFHCACVVLLGLGTADRFGVIEGRTSFDRTPLM